VLRGVGKQKHSKARFLLRGGVSGGDESANHDWGCGGG